MLTCSKQGLHAKAGGCSTLPSLLAGSCQLCPPAAPHILRPRGDPAEGPYFWPEARQLESFANQNDALSNCCRRLPAWCPLSPTTCLAPILA